MILGEIVETAQGIIEDGEWARAYELASKNDKTTAMYKKRKDCHCLDSIDLLLEYIEGVTIWEVFVLSVRNTGTMKEGTLGELLE